MIRQDGMKYGEMRRGPRSWIVIALSVMPGKPPMPEPIMTPVRSRSSSLSGCHPESSTACTAAANA